MGVSSLWTDHLFDGAERLIASSGEQREADLRRATSAAYYGIFHLVMEALADEFVGVLRRGSPTYALAYRRTDHRALRTCCQEVPRDKPFPRLPETIGQHLATREFRDFARKTISLQDRRHAADYDPLERFDIVGVTGYLADARAAATWFREANPEARHIFLALFAFPSR